MSITDNCIQVLGSHLQPLHIRLNTQRWCRQLAGLPHRHTIGGAAQLRLGVHARTRAYIMRSTRLLTAAPVVHHYNPVPHPEHCNVLIPVCHIHITCYIHNTCCVTVHVYSQ
jgi:hypothetical protein